eukprot:scaffold3772_cov390-Prasinococcus_capsulatus_cf.AAC.5
MAPQAAAPPPPPRRARLRRPRAVRAAADAWRTAGGTRTPAGAGRGGASRRAQRAEMHRYQAYLLGSRPAPQRAVYT